MNNFDKIYDVSKYLQLIKKSSCLAVIPARKGSKTIKNKNLKLLNGKPLIQYSIEHALNSKKINNVLVTSDSQKILEIAKKLGAIPVLRPDNLSGDIIHPEPSVIHSLLEFLKIKRYMPQCTILLQPTSPIRKIENIDSSIEDILSEHYNSSISGTKTHYFIWEKDTNLNWNPPYGNKRPRRQDFHQITETGSFFAFNTIEFLKAGDRIIKPVNIIETPQDSSYEIDTQADWEIMEALIRLKK